MKTHFLTTLAAAFLLLTTLLAFAPSANACIDPETVATVNCNYSDDFTEIEIRIGNLKLHTEQPNTFCSCALSSYDEFFQNPTYIAFVLAGTNTRYQNFDGWENTTGADDAWNSEFPFYPDWTGYISEVINSGLSTDDDVELVIRVSTPPGTYAVVGELDSVFSLATLGTDMWLPGQQTMAFDHPGIRNLMFDVSSLVYEVKPMSYFEQLDNGILSAAIDVDGSTFDLDIFPNPVTDRLWVSFNLPEPAPVSLAIRDISGRLVAELFHENLPEGEQRIPLDVQAILPKNGVYLLEIQVDGAKEVRKFVR